MLRTEPMQKIRIIALGSVRHELVRALHRMEVIDLRRSKLKLTDDVPSSDLPAISEMVVRMESVMSILGKPKTKEAPKLMEQVELHQLLNEVRNLGVVDRVFELSERKKTLADGLKAMADTMSLAAELTGMGIDFGKLKSKVLGFRAFELNAKSFETVKGRLKRVRHELVGKKVKNRDRVVAFLAFDRSQETLLNESLKDIKLVELHIEDKRLNSTPEKVVKELQAEKASMSDEIKKISSELEAIKEKHYAQMAGLTEMLNVEYERAGVSSIFKKMNRTIALEGWVPKKRMAEVKEALKTATNSGCYVEEMAGDELAPTLINRHRLLKPFDFLMEFYSLPRSDEIDPTYIFMATLAISYGIMISDVGYGVMSFLLAWLITKKTEKDGLLNNVAHIWMLFSIPIIIFGLLSNVFLGFELAPFKGIQVFDWIKGVPGIIVFVLMLGIVEIIIGLVLGFFNKRMHHENKLAISKLTSIFILVFGAMAIAGWLFHAFSGTVTMVSAAIAAVAFMVTAALSGMEAAELSSLIVHPLSYSRLLGFGLVSIVLSFLIDNGFTPSLSHGVLAFILFMILFFVLHTMNMILGIFEGIVQSARLNFIEVFSKFYTGNGIKFKPYQFKRRYTKE